MQPADERLTRVYREHGHAVLRRARQILGSVNEAEEVLQDLFLKLAEEPAQLMRASNPVAWLYGATTHACFNRIRNQKNRLRLLEQHLPSRHEQGPDAELRVVVQRLLAQMPEDCAVALMYHHVDQMTHAEIAEVMECSRRHVGDLIERATERAQLLESDQQGVPS